MLTSIEICRALAAGSNAEPHFGRHEYIPQGTEKKNPQEFLEASINKNLNISETHSLIAVCSETAL